MKCAKCQATLQPLNGYMDLGYVPQVHGTYQSSQWIVACVHEPVLEDWELENKAEKIARAFHEAYERLAPDYGYVTRKRSRVPWEQVPPKNADLMRAVCRELLQRRVLS